MKKFSIFITLVVGLALISFVVFAEEKDEDFLKKGPKLEDSEIFRKTVMEVKVLEVFEGLPHQSNEDELLQNELKRKDVVKITEFPFYSPSVQATNAEELIKLLSEAKSFMRYKGPKGCGGYHPDYAISWKDKETTYYALVCFGCHEIIFYDGKNEFKYDIKNKACENLRKLLEIYSKKRPIR